MLLALLLSPACRDLPEERWAELRDLRNRLSAARADRLLPVEHRRFEEEYAGLRSRYAELSSRIAVFGRDLDRLARAIDQLLSDGSSLIDELAGKRRDRLEELALEVSALENLLDPSRQRSLLPELRMQMTRARLQVGRIRFFLEREEVFLAEETLEELKASSRAVGSFLDALEARYSDPGLQRVWRELCFNAVRASRDDDRPVLVIDKFHREARWLEGGRPVRVFQVDLGWNGLHDKHRQGDGATPEGEYRVERLMGEGRTQYHRALLLDYPNSRDRAAFDLAVREGRLPEDARIGGSIEIHGEGGRGRDWTDGCVALSNDDMEVLFEASHVGMPVFVVGRCRWSEPGEE
jgi:hypothetical protein